MPNDDCSSTIIESLNAPLYESVPALDFEWGTIFCLYNDEFRTRILDSERALHVRPNATIFHAGTGKLDDAHDILSFSITLRISWAA